jgi:D-alanyl-lipoteichoic acid acyltransferase DltB (MBOAT superfamily)
MVFNSFVFLIFLSIVYPLYLLSQKYLKLQNWILLIASCVFYGSWDWRFLILMFVSITADFICGIKIEESDSLAGRKLFLTISLLINLFILGFFKYFNFFTSSLEHFLEWGGIGLHFRYLHVILPIGISFYTFEAMSYVFGIYKREVKATRSFCDYALFVTYFPHLVAGPIMRAKDLLPQIESPRPLKIANFYEGCHLIFWGLFQKVAVADNLALIVDSVFECSGPHNGIRILLSLYAFSFQIYCDFAGYSNIARGLGKCMGFDIMINFNLPYFSTNPSEFWKRWHISLSSWLRDYLYIPLGGNRKGEMATCRNLAITMLLGGLWHGAEWTFVVWGGYHGLLLIIHRWLKPTLDWLPKVKNAAFQNLWWGIKVLFFFHLVCLGWLFFRAQSFTQAMDMLKGLFFAFNFVGKIGLGSTFLNLLFFTGILMVVEIRQFAANDLMIYYKSRTAVKIAFYYLGIWIMIYWWISYGKQFIYFQF